MSNPHRIFSYSRAPVFPAGIPLPVPSRSADELARVDREAALRRQVEAREYVGRDAHHSWNWINENYISLWNQIPALPDPTVLGPTYPVPPLNVLVIDAVSFMWDDPWLQTSGMLYVSLLVNGGTPLSGAGSEPVIRHSEFWHPRKMSPIYVNPGETLSVLVGRNDPGFIGHMALSWYLSGWLVPTAGGTI